MSMTIIMVFNISKECTSTKSLYCRSIFGFILLRVEIWSVGFAASAQRLACSVTVVFGLNNPLSVIFDAPHYLPR